jgi:hypothetical protein
LCQKHLYDKDSNTKIISYKKIEVTSFPKWYGRLQNKCVH